MKRIWKLLRTVLMAAGSAALLCGCHGTEGMSAFVMPEEFDALRDYEITFWAKNDTNKTQTAFS